MTKQFFSKKLHETKKIKILTNSYKKESSLLYKNSSYPEISEKIHWTTQEIITRKRRIFSYLIGQISEKILTKETTKELWKIFREEISIDRENIPYHYWSINNYSAFLEKSKVFLNDNEIIFQNLAKVCKENQDKNIWMKLVID
jgi:hypothetical protein